jgi:predicted RNase H-like nuclease (RuvC/YqgF family)
MRQWRKKADQILEMRKNQLSKLDLQLADVGHEQVVSLQNQIAKLEATIEEMAQRKPDDVEHSQDLETAARFVEKLDKWLKNATARRNTLLKILEYSCRSIDRETEIPEAHYNELKKDELQRITAPTLGPAASIGGQVTTEDHSETVAPAKE